MPKSTSKSSGESASNAKAPHIHILTYIHATCRPVPHTHLVCERRLVERQHLALKGLAIAVPPHFYHAADQRVWLHVHTYTPPVGGRLR
eukprot:364369-Chlamydomonas_euryale.AAC.9